MARRVVTLPLRAFAPTRVTTWRWGFATFSASIVRCAPILMAAAWIGAHRTIDAENAAKPQRQIVTRVGAKARKGKVTTRRATVRLPL